MMLTPRTYPLLVKNIAAAAARMPATEIEAYEDDMTQGSTLMWSLTFQGSLTRFFKELTRFSRRKWFRKLWSSIMSLSIKRCVCFVYPGIPRDSSSNINAYDTETLDNLSSAYSDVLSALQQCLARAAVSPTTIVWV